MSIEGRPRVYVRGFFILLILVTAGLAIRNVRSEAADKTSISVWWPTDGAHVSGTQPIKALIDGADVGNYKIFWSVDGGGRTEMFNNYTDWPHKENTIDYTNWNWKGSGPYTITFTATDNSGATLSERKVNIYVDQPTSLGNVSLIAASTSTPLVVSTNATSTAATSTATTSAAIAVSISTPASTPVETSTTTTTVVSDGVHLIPTTSTVTAEVITAAPDKVISTTTTIVYAQPNANQSGLYVDQNSYPLLQAQSWATSRPSDAAIMKKIGAQSSGVWFGGWNGDVRNDVGRLVQSAKDQNTIPVLVAYNIPGRDCGGFSAGGATTKNEYLDWIGKFSAGIGSGKAIVILEPDALASMDCLSGDQKNDRYAMLTAALDIFKANSNAKVYVDAGHSGWIDTKEMANRLNKVGISKAAGFSLNVSNFVSTNENVSYGQTISGLTRGAHFVVDTSRNGSGSNGEWCNPSGRSLGQAPTLTTGVSNVDGYLWIKRPGESDGTCNGGPSAGTWWPDYALDMAKRAGY